MKLSKKLMILSLFLVIVCCIGSVSAAEDVDDISADLTVDDAVQDVETDNVQDDSDFKLESTDTDVLNDENSIAYLNASTENTVNDGKSWETACKDLSVKNKVSDNGTVHVASGRYSTGKLLKNIDKNITFVGIENNVVFSSKQLDFASSSELTFVNINFEHTQSKVASFAGKINFINCSFKTIPFKSSGVATFYNCTFFNYVENGVCFDLKSDTEFNYCKFLNISAAAIMTSTSENAVIKLYNSVFNNVTVSAVVDVENKDLVKVENVTNDTVVNIFLPPIPDSVLTIEPYKDYLLITLVDYEGNPISGAKVTITIRADASYHNVLTTDSEGKAYHSETWDTYNAYDRVDVWYADYDGLKGKYGPANATFETNPVKLIKDLKVEFENVSDVTGKTMLIVSVKNKINEIVANTNFTFTLNGKDYNATTDANGQFIASGLTGDVSIGLKYNGTEYNALDVTNNFTFPKTESEQETPTNTTPTNTTPTNTTPVDDKKPTQPATDSTKKVTPVATKITAKKATFKAKKKTKKYTITLKAGKKAVNKVKVTIKVGKKTYKATTNKKGKATFNLKKLTKKGKYTAVIKFAGNKNFKKTSTKVKIVVK